MNNLPSRPGEVFYIIRRTPYSESILSTKAVICEQSYMRWGRRKSQYRLVDIDNGEILDFKAQTFSEMLDFVEDVISVPVSFERRYTDYNYVINLQKGLKEIAQDSNFANDFPQRFVVGVYSIGKFKAEINVSRIGITLEFIHDKPMPNGIPPVGLQYLKNFPKTEKEMIEAVEKELRQFIKKYDTRL